MPPAHVLSWPGWTLGDSAVLVGLVVVGVGLPAAIAAWSHAFGIARFDDWAYRRVLSGFVATGHFSLVDWGAMTLVGQILWAAPFALVFGGGAWVAGFSVAVASVIGVGCAYWLARAIVGQRWGAVCTLLVLACPGFLVNTSTFMTDLPAFAADVACLALGVGASRRQGRARWALVAASAAVGCAGFSVREFGLAAPAAVLIALAFQDRRHLRVYIVTGACLLAACLVIYLWTSDLAGAQHTVLGWPTLSSLRALAGAYFALALFVSPLLPAAARMSRRNWRASPKGVATAGALTLVIGGALLVTGSSIFSGNYLTQQGLSATASSLGWRPVLFPAPAWRILEVVGLAAGVVLAVVAVTAVRQVMANAPPGRTSSMAGEHHEGAIIALFLSMCGAGLVVYGLFVRAPIFDRYVWPLVFALAILLAAKVQTANAPNCAGRAARGARAVPAATAALALITGLIAVGVTLTADSYDGARWSAGQDAVKAGYAAGTVDAGIDWVGGHATTPADRGRRVAGAPYYLTWYDQMFTRFKDCAVVSGSRLAGAHLVLLRTVTYEELGFAVPEHLYVYGVRSSSCTRR